MDDVNDVMSVGFFEPNSHVVAFKLPAAEQMANGVKAGSTLGWPALERGRVQTYSLRVPLKQRLPSILRCILAGLPPSLNFGMNLALCFLVHDCVVRAS
jgi:hypothetical protein